MSRTVSVNTWIEVDIDLEEVDDQDLIDELHSRSLGDRVNLADTAEDITEMFYAFKLGRNERAIELARKVSQDHTGRIL